ncbi:I78 family peptidase inhibitor [Falsigemmobacter faecalis]|uniref:I78 family peptidase inhibitor n=1 Tax=Falsigemmobacter faecalis TaxID=2488730 RepID=UPI0013159835|nr:I78 family peptidase inhibitor [Falsigemmobacter faecalis]
MHRKLKLLPIVAVLALAGCVEQQLATPGPIKIDDCGAAGYGGLVGTPLSRFNPAQVKSPVRVLAPGSVMTMDFRSERLNIEHNERGTITRIYCG